MICQFGFWLHHKIGKKKGPVFISLEERKVLFSVCFLIGERKRKPFLIIFVFWVLPIKGV
jgi:hypothetical protein